jgi:membrane protein implicated in regulation of membrane protease activity
MNELFPTLGPYFWWIVAGILLIAEMMQPGFFMIWLAAAAALTALIHLVMPMGWEGEVAVFAAFSGLAVALSWRIVTKSWSAASDQPLLNQRHAALVGRSFYLDQAISHGQGKIKVDDTLWDVIGDDMTKGARVKVIGVEGLKLKVLAD